MLRIIRRWAAASLLVSSFVALAAPGEPDPTFGVNGVQLLDFGTASGVTIIAAAKQQLTGKIVVAGTVPDGNFRKMALGRLNADGTPDADFGTAGWTIVGNSMFDTVPVAIAIDSNDGIRIVGQQGGHTFIAGASPSGMLDPFGGITVDYMSQGETPRAIAIHPNGYTLVAGGFSDGLSRRASVTVYSGGNRASWMGQNGTFTYTLGSGNNEARALLTYTGGGTSFFLAGYAENFSGNRDFVVVKLDTNLAIDPLFGIRTIDFGGQDDAFALGLRNIGHLVIAGHSESGGTAQLAMASVSAFDGSPDATIFGTDGKVLTPVQWAGGPAFGSISALMIIAPSSYIYPDGIYAIATVRPPSPMSGSRVVMARYDRMGGLVGFFGNGGFAEIPGTQVEGDVAIGGFEVPSRDALLTIASRSSWASLVATRHNLMFGFLDTSFGPGGVQQVQPYVPSQDLLMAAASMPDGGYVGIVYGSAGTNLFRTTPQGMLDPSFGWGNGVAPIGYGDYRIATQGDGKIIAAFAANVTWSPRIMIVVDRYAANGSGDTSFGSAGRTFIDFGGNSQSPYDIAVQPDGKIVVAGAVGFQGPYRIRMGVARLNADGSPDASFSGGGVVIGAAITGQDEEARGVAVGPDGKIVVGGTGSYGWTVYRLLPNGAVDTSWGGGNASFAVNCVPQLGSRLAIGPGGTVVVAGTYMPNGDACFARFLSSGGLDFSFGNMGYAVPMPTPYDWEVAAGVAFDSAGRIVGSIGSPSGPHLVRLNDNGTLDTSFNGGAAWVPGGNVNVGGLFLQGDNIVLWGTGDTFGDGDAMLARFQGGGALIDTTPDGFYFDPVTGVATSTVVTSNAVTITGIASPAPIGVTGGLYSIGCTSTFTASDATIVNGQTVCVRHTSSASGNASVHTTLTVGGNIGGVAATFTSTTAAASTVNTLFTATPPNPSGGPNPVSFSFTSSDPAATIRFECKLNAGPYVPCSSPQQFFPSNGTHTFQIRAVSAAGPDPTPASYTWVVDLILPQTTITSQPPEFSASVDATFAFTSSESGGRLECSLDNSPYQTCTSPKSYTNLIQGGHLFRVRAVDAVGNTDFTPAQVIWTVDTQAPNSTISSGPPQNSASTSATFTFTVNDPSATVECRVDSNPYSICTSPATYTDLPQGHRMFVVRATDRTGNADPSPAVYFWTVDTVASETTITNGPPAISTSTSASFSATASELGATLQCSLDGAAFAPCSWTTTYNGLSQGDHAFAVRAVDPAGNLDATPATASWTVDTAAPETTIVSGPSGTVTSASATFEFTANEGSTFECRLDGAAFAPCSSPATYTGLAEGGHSFEVRATDAVGYVDATPASRAFTVDTTSPETTITSGPSSQTSSQAPTFTFTSNDPGATFECSLDGSAFVACTSPASYLGVAEGAHTFEVRAIDAAGQVDATTARHTWNVDLTAPDSLILSGPPDFSSSSTVTFTFQSTEPGSTFLCGLNGAAGEPCSSPHTYTSLADSNYRFVLQAVDAAGNVGNPSVYWFGVDTASPDTLITSGPAGTVAQTTATFTFEGTETFGALECKLDAAAFAPCTSPATYSDLAQGDHEFQVRAKDQAGNVDPSPASAVWTVDTVAPETTVTAAPSGTVALTSAAISFTSNDPAAAFECALDGAAFSACTNPASYPGLAQGSHTFQVRARDAVGNTDATPESRTWTVDTAAPDTSITAGPSGTVASSGATFQFSASEGGATFECRLDGGAFETCASPASYSGLGQGSHTFEVRAKDATGNADETPASRAWAVDTAGPDTTIATGPSGAVASTSASFTFTATEGGSTFECKLDAGAFAACASPRAYSGLAQGSHTFQVRATDALGNVDTSPAARTWTVDTVAPTTTITSGPPSPTSSTSATFTFTSNAAGATFECKLDSGPFVACASPKTYTGLSRTTHTVQVRARDAAGNLDASPASDSWRVR